MKRWSAILLTVTLIISGCSPRADDGLKNNITLQLNWIDDPTFTEEYVANEKFAIGVLAHDLRNPLNGYRLHNSFKEWRERIGLL